MSRILLLNLAHDEERRAALLERNRLSLLWVERRDDHSFVGNVYRGRVVRVEPSIGAAFVDIGLERPGFLHASDVRRPWNGDEPDEPVRDGEQDIAALIERGADVVVQVTRDPLAQKGCTLTTYLSLPGRTLVLIPRLDRATISRRIDDDVERERLRAIVSDLPREDGVGIVARTASIGASAEDILEEYTELVSLHRALRDRIENSVAPALVHRERDFASRAVRELGARAPDGANGPLRVIVDDAGALDAVRAALSDDDDTSIEVHTGPGPLFHTFGIEAEVRALRSPRVALDGGASLVIQETEALWAIDVNSGRRRRGENLEATAVETDLLAAAEVARQIRLRDLAGLIVIDFIDCKDPANRAAVESAARTELARDPARMRIAPMSEFMVLEITRRRARTGAGRAGLTPCLACDGSGRVSTASAAGLAALRDAGAVLSRGGVAHVEIACAPAVADDLETREADLRALETRHGAQIEVVDDPALAPDRFEVRAV